MGLHNRLFDNYIWGLKYRPKTVDELILPKSLKDQLIQIIKDKNVPNLLFSGTAGVGKTSVAAVITEELDAEYLYINGSVDTGIDTLRTKIRQFVTASNWDNKKKIVVWDEAERGSAQLQDGAKAVIEEFSKSTSFIFISNHKNKIIEPLQSRLQGIEFNFQKKDVDVLKKEFFIRALEILKIENVEFDQKVVAHIIHRIFPDMRKCLNELQKYAQQGVLTDLDLVRNLSADDVAYFGIMKTKNFTAMRKYVANLGSDPQHFYSQLYESCFKFIEPNDLPDFILLLNKYAVESTMVIDPQINVMAFSTEAMINCKVKENDDVG